ncbi:hypothetical protein LEP1GSC052_2155 [Leptospira kmetyi serovar Malaysia str. Bejo-Iso9]|nr:hypothetical protein LEP1GSC052_2155 [Leptospira kmetyi serovar Malaysia str. Bejo-Iso9]
MCNQSIEIEKFFRSRYNFWTEAEYFVINSFGNLKRRTQWISKSRTD